MIAFAAWFPMIIAIVNALATLLAQLMPGTPVPTVTRDHPFASLLASVAIAGASVMPPPKTTRDG
jgi:hypothetical protein